ncbi:hypothetical protein ADIS_4579 [Lunatimonas lonarensis]|uniref:Uncharacterized protein n=1 Tax=Lunatimonas lonarensis TaxID=1232681 RepID=R7ZLB5_9BACT|nr:hypothetical protein [Lunatimonas lonarensis]EON74885.1 hypothetical protein ADIS_4579 [Lunatimonas lonarensis]
MLKFLTHIALSLLLLLSGMNYSLIQTHFYLNRVAIAEAFCENKAQPELACDGLCELDKRLDQAKDHKDNKKGLIPEEVQMLYLSTSANQVFLTQRKVVDRSECLFVPANQPQGAYLEFFHPPTA